MKKLGYKNFLLCIGTCTDEHSSINAFIFTSGEKKPYLIPWNVKKLDSPYRLISNRELQNTEMPKCKTPNMRNLYSVHKASTKKNISYQDGYWMKNKDNGKELKRIIDFIDEIHIDSTCTPTIDEENEVHIMIYNKMNSLIEDIHFPSAFPLEPPRITNKSGKELYSLQNWNYENDIFNSFKKYYIKH